MQGCWPYINGLHKQTVLRSRLSNRCQIFHISRGSYIYIYLPADWYYTYVYLLSLSSELIFPKHLTFTSSFDAPILSNPFPRLHSPFFPRWVVYSSSTPSRCPLSKGAMIVWVVRSAPHWANSSTLPPPPHLPFRVQSYLRNEPLAPSVRFFEHG